MFENPMLTIILFALLICASIGICIGIVKVYKKFNKTDSEENSENSSDEEKEKNLINDDIIKFYTYLINNASSFETSIQSLYYNDTEHYLVINDSSTQDTYYVYIGHTSKDKSKILLKEAFTKFKVESLKLKVTDIYISKELYDKLYLALLYPHTEEYKLKKLTTNLALGIKEDD